jgi:hypothetical protein
MDSESLQIDLERARDLERPHGGFDFSQSRLIFNQLRLLYGGRELAFEMS